MPKVDSHAPGASELPSLAGQILTATLVATLCLPATAGARPKIVRGQKHLYRGKCVTVVRVKGAQVSYRYKRITRRGNTTSTSSMNGSVPASKLGRRCGSGARRPSSGQRRLLPARL